MAEKAEEKKTGERLSPLDLDRIYDSLDILKELIKIFRGEPNINERIRIIADPEKSGLSLESLTNLSPSQIDSVEICNGIGETFPELQFLEDDCKTMMRANKSLDGAGIEAIIRFESVENFLSIATRANMIQVQPQQPTKPEREDDTKA